MSSCLCRQRIVVKQHLRIHVSAATSELLRSKGSCIPSRLQGWGGARPPGYNTAESGRAAHARGRSWPPAPRCTGFRQSPRITSAFFRTNLTQEQSGTGRPLYSQAWPAQRGRQAEQKAVLRKRGGGGGRTSSMNAWRSADTPEEEASTPSARSTFCILSSLLAAALADFSTALSPCAAPTSHIRGKRSPTLCCRISSSLHGAVACTQKAHRRLQKGPVRAGWCRDDPGETLSSPCNAGWRSEVPQRKHFSSARNCREEPSCTSYFRFHDLA